MTRSKSVQHTDGDLIAEKLYRHMTRKAGKRYTPNNLEKAVWVSVSEVKQVLDRLCAEGKVLCVGASTHYGSVRSSGPSLFFR